MLILDSLVNIMNAKLWTTGYTLTYSNNIIIADIMYNHLKDMTPVCNLESEHCIV